MCPPGAAVDKTKHRGTTKTHLDESCPRQQSLPLKTIGLPVQSVHVSAALNTNTVFHPFSTMYHQVQTQSNFAPDCQRVINFLLTEWRAAWLQRFRGFYSFWGVRLWEGNTLWRWLKVGLLQKLLEIVHFLAHNMNIRLIPKVDGPVRNGWPDFQ